MNSLKKIKIGDILELITDYHSNGAYKKLKENMELLDKENYAVMIRTLNFERQDFKDDLLYVTKKAYDFLEKSSVIPNDILMNKIANAGSVYIMPDMQKPVTCGMNLFLIRFNDTVNQRYMYYNMKNVEQYIKSFAHGTTTTTITKDEVRNIDLYIHSKKEQGKIEKLLTSIDKKIENNKKINSELESMAKTIYDYWFLQFEFPNEEGKPYKSSGGKMVWNEELGREIPEGWEVYKVKDCTKHINTGLNPRDNFKLGNGNIKYITVKNITTDGTIDFSGCDVIDEAARSVVHKRSQVSKGDILFASIAPLGRCIIVQEEPDNWDINESVFSIRPNTQRVCTEYLYMFFMSDYFVKKAEHSSTGSVFNGIRISTLEEMNILIPNEVIMKNFMLKTQNIFYMKYKNEKENQNLVSLRDFLLPLLMNGQVGFKENINIKDIEVGKEEVLT